MRVTIDKVGRRRFAAAAIGAALFAGACSPSSSPDAAPTTTTVDVDAIRWAREAFGPAGNEVGSLVRELEAVLESVRLDPADSDGAGEPAPSRAASIVAARRLADDLEDAVASWAPSTFVPEEDAFLDEPAVDTALDAWADVVLAASQAVDAARAELDNAEALLAIEIGLVAVTKGWEEPGSRSQQRSRFAELDDEAQAHLAAAQALAEVPSCMASARARLTTAELVAERTAELKGYVDRGQGGSFDEARERFHAAPWHDGLPGTNAADAVCWPEQSDVVLARARMDDALGQVADALNAGTGAPTEG